MAEKEVVGNHETEQLQNGTNHSRDELKKAGAPVKVFSRRNSVLTDLMELNHVQTVYNISVAICIILIFSSIAYYLTVPQKFSSDMEKLTWASGNISSFCLVWLFLNVVCFSVHQSLRVWSLHRHKVPLKILDFCFLVYFVAAGATMFTVTPYAVRTLEIPLITAFALLCEQVRMFMKIYSFVRENYPRIKRHNVEKDGKQQLYPDFSHFLYYMFAPVLVYRDMYPRTQSIRGSFVVANLLKVIACIFLTYNLVFRFIVDVFGSVGLEPFKLHHMVLIATGCVAVGSLIMFLAFYLLLHAWLNAFAELLRFGDRLFYKDWWNSTSFLQFYRMWNGVVYDWLYTYVYVDLHRLGVGRHVARLSVFIVSAVVHDYIICYALGFFFPALGIVYCTVGVVMIFVTNRKTSSSWNTIMWIFLFTGWGLLIFLYSSEWYSRKNCSIDEKAIPFYVPRMLHCLSVENSV